MPSIKTTKQQKTRLRKTLTADIGRVRELLNETEDDAKKVIKKKLSRLQNTVSAFKELQIALTDLIDETEDEGLIEARCKEEDEEYEFLLELEDVLYDAQQKLTPPTSNKGDAGKEESAISTHTTNNNDIRSRLPNLEIVKFNGDFLKFAEFWEHFEATIHNNSRLSVIEKFGYLKSYLCGAASTAIDGLMVCSDNYEEAVAIIKERFGKKALIVAELYNRLSKVKPPSYKPASLRRFVDEIELLLRSLKAQGKSTENDQILYTIQSKLPKDMLMEISRELGEDWQMNTMWEAIKKHVGILELVERRAESQYNLKQTPNMTNTDPSATQPASATALISTSTSGPSRPCVFCSGYHWSDQCTVCCSLDERKAKVKGLCFKCFSPRHKADECPKQRSCFHCKSQYHHSSLCPNLFKAQTNEQKTNGKGARKDTTKENREQIGAIAEAKEEAIHDHISTVASGGQYTMMQTITTTVRNSKKPNLNMELRILLDSGSSKTFVSKSLAQQLQLDSDQSTTFNMSTFGNENNVTAECDQAEIELKLIDNSFKKVSVSIWPNSHLTKPMERNKVKEETIQEILHYKLADKLPKETEQSDVDIVIGNDFINDFMLFWLL